MSNLSTVRFVAQQRHFKLLDAVDQELPDAAGQHVLCFLVAPRTNVGHQDLALEPPVHPVVSASGFLSVLLNFFLNFYFFVYLFMACVGSLFLCEGFL